MPIDFLTNQVLSPQKTFIPILILLGVIKRKPYWTVPLLHQNLKGTTLSSKDIPMSPYTKGENNNDNIVSSLAQYSSWIINLYFKVIQVLFLFC